MNDGLFAYVVTLSAFAFFVVCPRLGAMTNLLNKHSPFSIYWLVILGTFASIPMLILMTWLIRQYGLMAGLGLAIATDLAAALILTSVSAKVAVAFVGSRMFSFQQGFFTLLAVLYVAVGLLMIFSKSLLHKLRNIRIARLLGLDFGEGSLKRLGLIAGLTIPACAIPLLTVLVGQTLFTGKLLMGFVSLFTFGLALTVPLAVFSFFRAGTAWLGWIAARAGKLKVLGGIGLVLIGIATYFSGSYWSRAFLSVQ